VKRLPASYLHQLVDRPASEHDALVVEVDGRLVAYGDLGPVPGEPGRRVPSSEGRDRAITEIGLRSSHPVPILPAATAMGFQRSLPVLGAEITALNDGLRALLGLKGEGIFVVNVGAGTPASESGLREADVILRAERRPVGDPVDLMRVLSEMNKSSLQLNIIRMKKPQTITLRW